MSLEIIIRENYDIAYNPGYHYAIVGSLEELIRIVQASISGIKSNPFNPDSKPTNPPISNQLTHILEKLIKIKEKK